MPGHCEGIGGPASFQRKLVSGLATGGVSVTHDLADVPYDAVLISGGTRHVTALRRCKRRGIRIVQRLDGINWMHRVRRTSIRCFALSEIRNWLMVVIRRCLADRIVYQSQFVRRRWETVYGPVLSITSVVHNGVDLDVFSPAVGRAEMTGTWNILLVEGNMFAGYELGLRAGAEMAKMLNRDGIACQITIVGNVLPGSLKAKDRGPWLNIAGPAHHSNIAEFYRQSHLFYSSDTNPACPNSVIEALACGVPVIGYATGALPELVTDAAGCCVPYGGDPWKLEPPDVPGLARAAKQVIARHRKYSNGARTLAEERYDVKTMVDAYREALLG